MNLAESLNLGCACRTLDPQQLRQTLAPLLGELGLDLETSHPHLFSPTVVFLDPDTRDAIAASVAALHRVMSLPGWREHALRNADPAARVDFGPSGACMGYDFHVTAHGPRLIEVNTNAGGIFLNAAVARAHRACCDAMGVWWDRCGPDGTALDAELVAMFRAEWHAQRGPAPLRTLLIVDDDPQAQYLAPEFELARRLFVHHGITAAVGDARLLRRERGRLWHPALPDGLAVDLVYNRLTDFDLSAPPHAALRAAFLNGEAVVTPHPGAHALQADKRLLHTLGDDDRLAAWGARDEDRRLLREVVPATRLVRGADAQALWGQRRQLFFKTARGFGARAAYRGDKLTRKVWADIIAGDFVAQDWVPPGERLVYANGQATRLKVDLRAYAFRGQVLLLAARTWEGQTTNFRTPGGGFAPVLVLPRLPIA